MPIRVTRFGKPSDEVAPPSPSEKPVEWLGSMADAIEILGDIVSPVMDESKRRKVREEEPVACRPC